MSSRRPQLTTPYCTSHTERTSPSAHNADQALATKWSPGDREVVNRHPATNVEQFVLASGRLECELLVALEGTDAAKAVPCWVDIGSVDADDSARRDTEASRTPRTFCSGSKDVLGSSHDVASIHALGELTDKQVYVSSGEGTAT